MSIKQTPPEEVFSLFRKSADIRLIDVREPEEFSEMAAEFAESYPLSAFNAAAFGGTNRSQAPIFLVCRSGKRSMKAAEILSSAGLTAIYNVEGGMLAWVAAGLPVIKKT